MLYHYSYSFLGNYCGEEKIEQIGEGVLSSSSSQGLTPNLCFKVSRYFSEFDLLLPNSGKLLKCTLDASIRVIIKPKKSLWRWT